MIMIIVISAILSLFIAAPFVNDNVARQTAKELAGLPLPDDTEYIESVYSAGKLVGSGNGMQYFGAILIESELSLEELKEYYSEYGETEDECVVCSQAGTDIEFIEHEELEFKTEIDGDDYYIVYSWGDNHTIFHGLDIRGH